MRFFFNTTQATLTVTVSYSLRYTFGLYSKHFMCIIVLFWVLVYFFVVLIQFKF